MLGVSRGMLDLPEPRLAVAGVIMGHEVEAGVLSLSQLGGLAWPEAHLNRHRVRGDPNEFGARLLSRIIMAELKRLEP